MDINPITAQRTGTLETYLPKVEEYLDGVREAREHEPMSFEHRALRAALFPEQAEPEVTLTVAECGEFHNLGEFYENIPTVEEAIAIWKQIPPERMNGIPAIGISIHKPGDEPYQDTEMEARVWEIRMPDLTPAEQLAVEFDRFVYDYDRNQYHDSIQSMTENVAVGAEAIEKAIPDI